MNESQTRAELIDPKLKDAGWAKESIFTLLNPKQSEFIEFQKYLYMRQSA